MARAVQLGRILSPERNLEPDVAARLDDYFRPSPNPRWATAAIVPCQLAAILPIQLLPTLRYNDQRRLYEEERP